MTPAGERNRLIIFQRLATTTNDYNETIEGEPVTIATARAKVMFGTGQERRAAAQEEASQAATFIVPWTPTLAGLLTTDRISGLGGLWNIKSVVPVGLNREIHVTAVRPI